MGACSLLANGPVKATVRPRHGSLPILGRGEHVIDPVFATAASVAERTLCCLLVSSSAVPPQARTRLHPRRCGSPKLADDYFPCGTKGALSRVPAADGPEVD